MFSHTISKCDPIDKREYDIKLSDIELQQKLCQIGIDLDVKTGHLYYNDHFKPLALEFDLVFVRHGETFGNCGQSTRNGKVNFTLVKFGLKNHRNRVFQGDVDADINQLTTVGKKQAENVAKQLENNFLNYGWEPDVILTSPLKRAIDTALPFIKLTKFDDRYKIHAGIKEISFGAWENRRLCDFPQSSTCHSFYLSQHALVKKAGMQCDGSIQEAENFSELLLRAYNVLTDLNIEFNGKKVLLFSHSMFGAACHILLGKGQSITNEKYLAFDGKNENGIPYTFPHATPIAMNFDEPSLIKQGTVGLL